MKRIAVILIAVFMAGSLYRLSMDKIDLSQYRVTVDYGLLNNEQIRVMDAILLCGASDTTVIAQNLSAAEFDQVMDCVGLYFGSNLTHWNAALWRPGYAEVKPELLRKLQRDKAILDARIDCILSDMYEGSVRFKLLQISRYIAGTIAYSPALDHIEPLSGLSGSGSCMTYAMLFYKMAARLGISVRICYGYADNGQGPALHAWNMAVLNGKPYFYDLTWFDRIVPNIRYLHSETPWDRSVFLNKKCAKGGINGN